MFYNFSKSMSCFNQGYFHDAVAGGCKNYYSPFSFLIDGLHIKDKNCATVKKRPILRETLTLFV